MVDETRDLVTRDVGEAHSFGIAFHERNVPILPQAVGGILTQALYKAFVELGPQPLSISNNFEHDYSQVIESRVCFDVGVSVTASANMTGIYMLTNRRIATVLSLMGFDFARHQNLEDLREYNFDILVETEHNTTVIGHGLLKNAQMALRPVMSNNRLVWPRCNGPPPAAGSSRRVKV